MEYGLALIDKAAEMCGGNYAELARQWGLSQTMVSLIKKGEKKLPLRRVAKLASIAGVDPKEAMLRVAEEQAEEGSEERDLLGKALATTVAAMLLFFVVLGPLLPSQSYAKGITGSHKTSVAIHRGMCRKWLARWCGWLCWPWGQLSHSGTRTSALALWHSVCDRRKRPISVSTCPACLRVLRVYVSGVSTS